MRKTKVKVQQKGREPTALRSPAVAVSVAAIALAVFFAPLLIRPAANASPATAGAADGNLGGKAGPVAIPSVVRTIRRAMKAGGGGLALVATRAGGQGAVRAAAGGASGKPKFFCGLAVVPRSVANGTVLGYYAPEEWVKFAPEAEAAQSWAMFENGVCDCMEDGTDEPTTGACVKAGSAGAVTDFECLYDDLNPIPATLLHDGKEDCCDGSDENIVLPLSSEHLGRCNRVHELRVARLREALNVTMEGYKICNTRGEEAKEVFVEPFVGNISARAKALEVLTTTVTDEISLDEKKEWEHFESSILSERERFKKQGMLSTPSQEEAFTAQVAKKREELVAALKQRSYRTLVTRGVLQQKAELLAYHKMAKQGALGAKFQYSFLLEKCYAFVAAKAVTKAAGLEHAVAVRVCPFRTFGIREESPAVVRARRGLLEAFGVVSKDEDMIPPPPEDGGFGLSTRESAEVTALRRAFRFTSVGFWTTLGFVDKDGQLVDVDVPLNDSEIHGDRRRRDGKFVASRFTHGETCAASGKPREGRVVYRCGAEEKITHAAPLGPCDWFVTFATPNACTDHELERATKAYEKALYSQQRFFHSHSQAIE